MAKQLGSVAYVDRTWPQWTGDRKKMAGDTLRMWHDHPILGVGLGDSETAYPRCRSDPSDAWVDHAHNDDVEAAAETGWVGAILIFCALVLLFVWPFAIGGTPFDPTLTGFAWAPPLDAAACWCTAWGISTCTSPPTLHGFQPWQA